MGRHWGQSQADIGDKVVTGEGEEGGNKVLVVQRGEGGQVVRGPRRVGWNSGIQSWLRGAVPTSVLGTCWPGEDGAWARLLGEASLFYYTFS